MHQPIHRSARSLQANNCDFEDEVEYHFIGEVCDLCDSAASSDDEGMSLEVEDEYEHNFQKLAAHLAQRDHLLRAECHPLPEQVPGKLLGGVEKEPGPASSPAFPGRLTCKKRLKGLGMPVGMPIGMPII